MKKSIIIEDWASNVNCRIQEKEHEGYEVVTIVKTSTANGTPRLGILMQREV